MITNEFIIPAKTSSRVFKLLAKEVGPPAQVKHFDKYSFFAQFLPFTLTSKGIEGTDTVKICLYLHGSLEDTLPAAMGKKPQTVEKIHSTLLKRIKHIAGIDIDVLDPFG